MAPIANTTVRIENDQSNLLKMFYVFFFYLPSFLPSFLPPPPPPPPPPPCVSFVSHSGRLSPGGRGQGLGRAGPTPLAAGRRQRHLAPRFSDARLDDETNQTEICNSFFLSFFLSLFSFLFYCIRFHWIGFELDEFFGGFPAMGWILDHFGEIELKWCGAGWQLLQFGVGKWNINAHRLFGNDSFVSVRSGGERLNLNRLNWFDQTSPAIIYTTWEMAGVSFNKVHFLCLWLTH